MRGEARRPKTQPRRRRRTGGRARFGTGTRAAAEEAKEEEGRENRSLRKAADRAVRRRRAAGFGPPDRRAGVLAPQGRPRGPGGRGPVRGRRFVAFPPGGA